MEVGATQASFVNPKMGGRIQILDVPIEQLRAPDVISGEEIQEAQKIRALNAADQTVSDFELILPKEPITGQP